MGEESESFDLDGWNTGFKYSVVGQQLLDLFVDFGDLIGEVEGRIFADADKFSRDQCIGSANGCGIRASFGGSSQGIEQRTVVREVEVDGGEDELLLLDNGDRLDHFHVSDSRDVDGLDDAVASRVGSSEHIESSGDQDVFLGVGVIRDGKSSLDVSEEGNVSYLA